MIKSVCIVGCGWFGLPLAQALVAGRVKVFGSKRGLSESILLKEQGINGFKLDLDEPIQDKASLESHVSPLSEALAADCLVINIPPELRKSPDAYLQRLTQLKQLIAGNQYKKIVFVSTTGVYPQADKLVSELDASAHSEVSDKLLQAEAMFSGFGNSVIVRFAGLVGPKRHPGRFLAGKTELPGASAAVNLVHLNDCILAVSTLLFNETASGIYNVCAPKHPTRQEFYCQAARDLGLVEPEFLNDDMLLSSAPNPGGVQVNGKRISSERLISELNFEFQFNDPLDMLLAC